MNNSAGVIEAAFDPVAAAKLAKLRHVRDDMPGITRHKARHGLDYRHPDGELVRDIETLKRIGSLVVPPAWTGVWICSPPERAYPGYGPRQARAQAVSLPPALA
jgi:DNA topoisomerase-1